MGLTNLTILPAPGYGGAARTIFVGAAALGYGTGQTGQSTEMRLPTLLAALDATKVDPLDRGTDIIVAAGHTENISAADYFSAIGARKNIRILGEGHGTQRPALTWTTATSTWLFDTADIVLQNFRLFLAGPHAAGTAVTVAAPITVTAAGCKILDCDIKAGFDADQIVTIGITVTTGGDSFQFARNKVQALVAAPMVTFLRTTAVADTVIEDNEIVVATTVATVGVVQALTTAPTLTMIRNNYLNNLKADSTAVLTPMAAQTGVISDNYLKVFSGLLHITAGSATERFNNFGVNAGGDEVGVLLGTASA
jgi:hypothetical protein